VPLNYQDFEGEKIVVHAELVYEWKDNKAAKDLDWNTICRKRKFLVYLCGGPGDGNPWDRNEAFNNLMLERGYCILFPDYRGTGQSTPITAESLAARFPNEETRRTQQLVDYVSLFRQDNIVRDLEAMRQTIEEQVFYPGENLRFTLHGQSFGGWVALTYLSFLGREKHRIAEVFLTAGLAPITKSPELVYRALYGPITWANDHYYQVFKSDIDRVKYIFKTLDERGINYPLRDGTSRVLNAQMFMTLGRQFISGMDGMNKVHRFVGALFDHLKSQEGTGDTSISATVLAKYAEIEGFKLHARPLYGILHESIYITGPGKASKWAAYRVGKHIKGYAWLNQEFKVTDDFADKLYFSGEMIYPFMMDSLESDLLRQVAQEVAEKKDWPQIYDLEQLKRNDKPLRALVYPEDLAVNLDAGEETLARVGNSKSVVAPYHWEHGSLRTRTADVVRMLY
ncbi:Alpha/Beta hydrolase protein, partial [Cladorrhinum sp. PSN259]